MQHDSSNHNGHGPEPQAILALAETKLREALAAEQRATANLEALDAQQDAEIAELTRAASEPILSEPDEPRTAAESKSDWIDDLAEICEVASPVQTITASSVRPANVCWLWRGWIPLGMLTLLVGQPGRGKTTFAERLAADVSRGTLDGSISGEPADVLIVSYEDALVQTLRPRLEAADAELDRVHFLACRNTGAVLDLTSQLPQIEHIARERQARLLVIDPLVAGLPAGQVNSHRDQEVRSVLAPIATLAERCDLAVIASMHFSKSATSALIGAGGSIGFVGAARSILVFGLDPTDERGEHGPARVLAHAKTNVGRLQRSRQVAVLPHVLNPFGDPIETSVAMIGDECDVSADDLVQTSNRAETPRQQAMRFLRDLLADGPHRATEIYGLAEDDGIAERTLKNAKRDLGVESERRDGVWWWRLPERSEDDDADDGDQDELW